MRPVAAPRCWTRRVFLFSGVAASGLSTQGEKGALFASDWRRYPDPVTEFEVYRLTDPAYTSGMPAYYTRGLSRHNHFLLFWSERTGSPQAFRMDLKSGECRQLTQAKALDGSSLTLLPDERSFCFFDGQLLRQTDFMHLREREIYQIPSGWQRCPGFSVSGDGSHALFGECRNGASRLRSVALRPGAARTVVEVSGVLSDPLARPKRAQILYRQQEENLWLVNSDGSQNRKLRFADGRIGPANWSPDGKTLLYLNFPNDNTQLRAIREHSPDQNLDKLVAKTSQFAHFGFNANTSVFVGASANRASPTVLILLRLTRRELTLCEHRASDPAMVAPIFSADSQKIYFQSDRHGKPAIYQIHVEKLVEKTELETG